MAKSKNSIWMYEAQHCPHFLTGLASVLHHVCQSDAVRSGWLSTCIKMGAVEWPVLLMWKKKKIVCNCLIILKCLHWAQMAKKLLLLFFSLPFKAAVEIACVIFRELLHQNKFLSQSAHFLSRAWDFSARGDLLWVSRSRSSRRSGGIYFPHSYARWRGRGEE